MRGNTALNPKKRKMSKISPKVTKQIQAHNGLTAFDVQTIQDRIDVLVNYLTPSVDNADIPASVLGTIITERDKLMVKIGTYTPVYPSDNPYRFLNSSLDEDAQYDYILRGY